MRTHTTWRSGDFQLATTERQQRFQPCIVLSDSHCGACQRPQRGAIWASNGYVLCLECAAGPNFIAPDLRTYMPHMFVTATPQEETEEDETVEPEPLTTKRDKDFNPHNYSAYRHNTALSGRAGCAGYRCRTYPAPLRTIPANTPFMLGSMDRGQLCMDCFTKLNTQYQTIGERANCRCCETYIRIDRMHVVSEYGEARSICGRCRDAYWMPTPGTSEVWVQRTQAVFVVVPATDSAPARRLYAQRAWAESNWFEGHQRWYLNETDRDRELYEPNPTYIAQAIDRESRAGNTVLPYGTNVIKMHGFPAITKRNDLCFGVELEMQPDANHAHREVVDILGGKYVMGRPYILCADSSLGSEGVEMITLPYTLANHKSDKYMPWTKVLGDLRKVAKSGQGTTACGMHVHINRRALSHLQMGKMLLVINSPEMQELIVTIAQRSETSYARRFYKKVTEGGKIIGSHGDALNMSNQKGTCELRIFRGNLRYERVMKNLEFAEALCLYASEQSIQRVADPAQMVAWIRDNKMHYPHLVKFLAEEYQPTKAFARAAATARAQSKAGNHEAWANVAGNVLCVPTEGDI